MTLGVFSTCRTRAGPRTEGDVESLRRSALRMRATSPVRENGTIELVFEGPPGVPIWLRGRLTSTPVFLGKEGTCLLPVSGGIAFLGTTDAAGTLQRSVVLSPLAPAMDARVTFVQGFYIDQELRVAQPVGVVLGEGSMIVGLDESL